MTVKKAPENEAAHEALRAIYEEDRPEGDDIKRLVRRPRRRRRVLLYALLAFLIVAAGLALAGYAVFGPNEKFSGKTVTVSVEGPKTAASGDESAWTMHVKNSGDVDIKSTAVNARYPDGFQFVSSQPSPSNEFKNSWEIGTIKAGAEKTVSLSGRLIGELDSEKTFAITVSYQPANFSSDFTAETSFTTRLTSSTLALDITAPTTAASGQAVEYVITVTNTSTADVEKMRLAIELPGGLQDVKKSPAPSDGRLQWDEPKLGAGKKFAVTIKGKLQGNPQETAELKAKVGVVSADGSFHVQRERSALVLFLAPTLNVGVTVNSAASGLSAKAGDKLKAVVAYSNDSDTLFTNVTLQLAFNGQDSDGATVSIVDGDAVKATEPFAKATSGQLISWNKETFKDLERVAPGAKGNIDVTLPVKKSLRSVGTGKNLAINLVAKVNAADVGGTGTPYEKQNDPVVVKMTTELRLAVEGRYYGDEGEPLGSGPLPPEVGVATQYQISWFLTNTMNGAKDVLLKATLADGVEFARSETTGGNNITYDATTREVRWRIEKVDAGVGQTLPTLTGSFYVSIIPKDTDVGKVLDLVGKTALTGADVFSGVALSLEGDAVTTDLKFDPFATGKGQVVAPATNTNSGNTNSP